MCGRFTLSVPSDVLQRLFALNRVPELLPRYNVAPTQAIAIVRRSDDGGRVLEVARWGLVPAGSKDLRVGAKMINARQETLFEKPAFRSAAVHRRCLVPADGFFEWKKLAGPEGEGRGAKKATKQPYRIGLAGQKLFAMAGVYERFVPEDGGELETVSIVTTSANALVAPIHDRMPVIIREEDFTLWLDPKVKARPPLERLLQPIPAELMEMVPVSSRVNDVNNDDPSCVSAPEDAPPTEEPARPAKPTKQLGFGF